MKRKLLIMTALLAMVVMVCSACGNDKNKSDDTSSTSGSTETTEQIASPKEVTEEFLQAVKNSDADKIKEVYAGEKYDLKDALMVSDDEDDAVDSMMRDTVAEKMLEFDYKIGKETIKDDKATVNVDITTYNFGDTLVTFFKKYVKQGLPKLEAGASDSDMEKLGKQLLKAQIKQMKKNYDSSVKLKLTKKAGKWLVDKMDDGSAFDNALMGNLEKGYEEIGRLAEDAQNAMSYDEG